MRLTGAAIALAGTLLAIALIAVEGFSTVGRALVSARWGISVAALPHLATTLLCAWAWRSLLPPTDRRSLAALFLLRWVREGVNSLLPVAQVGGIVVQARLLTFRGAASNLAGASAVVDLTLEVITLFMFALVGLGILATSGQVQSDSSLTVELALGFLAVLGFAAAQRFGMIRPLARVADRLARRSGWHAPGSVAAVGDAIHALYGNRRRLAAATVLHFAAWLVGAAEIWVLLRFMGQTAGAGEAIVVASLGYAVRAVGFLVPGALGVQEGGFMLVATLVGIPAPVGLALSLARRAREILLGVPALVIWHRIERRRLSRPAGCTD